MHQHLSGADRDVCVPRSFDVCGLLRRGREYKGYMSAVLFHLPKDRQIVCRGETNGRDRED